MKRKVAPSAAPAHEHDLVQIAAKASVTYENDSLAALTVYSLFWLHEWGLRRTIEAVAVLNWRLFPDKFGMLGFQQFPDAFRTNRSLLQGQPKYRNWLTGTATKGFSLNPRGMALARDLTQRIGVPLNASGDALGTSPARPAAAAKARSIEPDREVQRVRAHRLFGRWQRGEMTDVDLIHVHSLLDIFDHTPAKIREKRMRDLERAAEDINDIDVARFLSDLRQQFPLVFA